MQNVHLLINNIEDSIQKDYLALRDLSYTLAKLYLQLDKPIEAGKLLINVNQAKEEYNIALMHKEDSIKLSSDFEKIKLDDNLLKNKLVIAKDRIKEINTILGALILEYSNNNILELTDAKTIKYIKLINKARSKKISSIYSNILLSLKSEKKIYNYIGNNNYSLLPDNTRVNELLREKELLELELDNINKNLDKTNSFISEKKVDEKIVNKDKIIDEYDESSNNLKEAIISYGMYLIYNTSAWQSNDEINSLLQDALKVKNTINVKNKEIEDLKTKGEINDYLQLFELNRRRINSYKKEIENIQNNIDELNSQNKNYQAKIELLKGSKDE